MIGNFSYIIRSVRFPKKPVKFGPLASLLLTPLLLVAGILYAPYMTIAFAIMNYRERRFAKSMQLRGRTIDWSDFIRELNDGKGMLIIERFSWVGPIRKWWTTDDVYDICPYSLADWFKMLQGSDFDSAREWCHEEYTGPTGRALLVIGNADQWRTIRGDRPRTFRKGVKYLEVPPPRKSM
jgi:hypothetical protein